MRPHLRVVLIFAICAANAQVPTPLYTIRPFAGASGLPPNGDGGPAQNALVSPESLALDPAGNLYIGEAYTNHVRKIAPSGVITSVAPAGMQLSSSLGVATNVAGDLFIADTVNNRVLKLSASGTTTLVAGSGAFTSDGDGGPATAAGLRQPFGLAVDRRGNLYVAEYRGYRVRKVTADGLITTVAGNGDFGSDGDGGLAINARIAPWGLAVDAAGALYITDGSKIRKVDAAGVITTIAGGAAGFSGDGGPASSAQLNGPTGIAFDSAGNLYIADTYNYRVRKITPDGIIRTIAGTGINGSLLGPDRAAAKSQITYPMAVQPDNAGNLYVAENPLGGWIRKIDAQGRISPVAGMGPQSVSTGDGGPAIAAHFANALSVALGADGSVYISDPNSRRVRRVDSKGIVSTIAGDGEQGYLADGVPAATAPLNQPQGIALDAPGNLYIADTADQRIRKVGVDGLIETVAGTGTAGFSGDGGAATSAHLSSPIAVIVDSAGNLYISDAGNHRIRRVGTDGSITTIADSLLDPAGMAIDAAGNLYIADSGNHRVLRRTPDGTISTFAGTGATGRVVDGLPATQGILLKPVTLALDPQGNLFIGDIDDNSIRRVRPDGIMDTIAGGFYSVPPGGDPAFATAVSPTGIAIDADGSLYIAESQIVVKASVFRGNGSPQLLAVLDGAAHVNRKISPGEVVTLVGTDLGPATGVSGSIDASGRIATQLAGVRVTFDGTPAPILYAQSNQVNVVAPFEISTQGTVEVLLNNNGKQATMSVATAPSTPEVLLLTPSPRGGQAAALNEDGTINSPANPAMPGSIMTFYVTGGGAMMPSLVDGTVATDTTAAPVIRPTVSIFGTGAEVLYAGPAPGLVAGILQINVRLPTSIFCNNSCIFLFNPNALSITVSFGQIFSTDQSTIAVAYR